MMLKILMPSLSELVNADYASVKSAESERLINKSLSGLIPSAAPELLQISGIPGAGKSYFLCRASQKELPVFEF